MQNSKSKQQIDDLAYFLSSEPRGPVPVVEHQRLQRELFDLKTNWRRERAKQKADLAFRLDAERLDAEGFGFFACDVWGWLEHKGIETAFDADTSQRILTAESELQAAFRKRVAVLAEALRKRQADRLLSS